MQKDFPRNLIKGKIAEIVFQQMFVKEGKFTVIPFGYDRILPELVKYRDNKFLNGIKNAPDFVLAYKDENVNNIYLVEVKYRSHLNTEEILNLAVDQNKRWSPSWIFVATPQGFFLDNCRNIINNQGRIKKLLERFVSREIQDEYLKILNEFERE